MRTTTSIPRIYTDQNGLKHHELTEKLIGIFYGIYNELGHGFLESVYEQAFSVALAESGIFSSAKLRCRCFSTGRKSAISEPTC
jgi:hypothetical protein